MKGLHVVFGAGQVGAGLARRLAAEGHRVRVVRRGTAAVGDGIEVVSANAMDKAQVIAAAEGAAVLYHCMNPSAYTKEAWETEFPAFGEALIAAALAHDARLVCLDNLYGYGEVDGPRTEATPMGANGPKGRVRVAFDARLREARDKDGLRFVVGRAGDFFGPGAAEQSLMSAKALSGLVGGGRMWLIGDADASHAFSYVPDVVRGLAAFGQADADVEGRVFHFPVVLVSPRALVGAVAGALGATPRATALPAWSVRALGVVVPLFAQLRETLYQWDRPFLVDDSAFRARFPGLATDLATAAAGIAADVRAMSPLAAAPVGA